VRYRYIVVAEQSSLGLEGVIDALGLDGWRVHKLELAVSVGAIMYVAIMERAEPDELPRQDVIEAIYKAATRRSEGDANSLRGLCKGEERRSDDDAGSRSLLVGEEGEEGRGSG